MFGTKRNDTIQDKAEDFLDDAGKSISELGREARKTAHDAKKDMVKTLHTAAHTIRKEAREANASKEIREQADSVAEGFERAAHYLKKHSYEDIGEDVVEGVRANPWRTLAIIFIVGLVIGLILRGGDQPQPQAQDNYRRP